MRQISMFPVEFEPAISASERPQTYPLHRAATGTGTIFFVSTVIASTRTVKCLSYGRRQCDSMCMCVCVCVSHCVCIVRACRGLRKGNGCWSLYPQATWSLLVWRYGMRSSKSLTRYASLRVRLARPLYFRFETDMRVVCQLFCTSFCGI